MRGGLALPLLMALLVVGCGGTPDATPRAPSAATSSPATEPRPAPSPSTPSDFPTCDPAVASGIQETVDAQLRAFADGDYRAALALASDDFRASVTLKDFRRIIREAYPDVADAVAHQVLDCRQLGEASVQALVSVTGRQGATSELGYRFVRQPEGWRIDGASTLSRAEPQAV